MPSDASSYWRLSSSQCSRQMTRARYGEKSPGRALGFVSCGSCQPTDQKLGCTTPEHGSSHPALQDPVICPRKSDPLDCYSQVVPPAVSQKSALLAGCRCTATHSEGIRANRSVFYAPLKHQKLPCAYPHYMVKMFQSLFSSVETLVLHQPAALRASTAKIHHSFLL